MPESSTQTLAKTTRPALASSVVARPRLFQRLDDARHGAAAWIHGMPGAGKTCLVSSWVEARGLDALWYQVDGGDRDPASFFFHLLHAARRRCADAARLPVAPGGDVRDPQLRKLFRGLYGEFREPFVFVLDNSQEVPLTSALHRVLAIAAEEAPRRGTVIFLARQPPGPAMAKLRGSEVMTVITPQDLEVTADELRAIAAARDVSLDEDRMRSLEESTRGWAAGLVLMLEHARGGGAVTRTPDGLAPQVVFDYLAGEVFEKFDAQVRDTLCALAGLRRCTAALACDVAASPQAGTVLQNLARNSYFLNRVDEEHDTWFEFHPLFRNFLAKQAREHVAHGERVRRIRTAAAWLQDNGSADEALRVLAQAGEWDALADTVARHGAALFAAPASGGMTRWLQAVPDEVAAARPWLLHWIAACRLQEDPRAARRQFARAYEGFVRGADPVGAALSASGVLRAVLAECDDLSLADAWIPRVCDGLARLERSADPPRGLGLESAARVLQACLVLRGGGDDAKRTTEGAAGAPRAVAGPWPMSALAACLRAEFATAADLIPDPGSGGDGAGWALAAAGYHLLRGEHRECAAAAARARDAPDGGDLAELLASAAEAACELSGAGAGASDAPPALAQTGPARLRAALAGYLDGARLCLQGDSLAAFQRAREGASAAAQLGLRPLEVFCHSAMAMLAADCGDADEAVRALARADSAQATGLPLLDFTRGVAAARVAQLSDEPDAALPALEAAFAIGRGLGLRLGPGLQSRALAELCALALRAGVETEYARSLLRAYGLVGHAPRDAPEQWPWPVRITTLGGLKVLRHDEVLRLSGKGESRLVELLKLLAALGGRNVPQEQLAGILWPHVDGDYAYRSFNTTVYRLRRLLDVPDAVLVQEARVSLNPECCWLDTWALESLTEAVEAAFWAGAGQPRDEAVKSLSQDLTRLHRGAFLGGDEQHAGVLARRAQLRRRVQRALVRLAGHWEARGEGDRAVDLLQHAVDADSAAEGLYRELMLLLDRLGRPAEVLEVYEICCSSLAAARAGSPDASTREIAERVAPHGPA